MKEEDEAQDPKSSVKIKDVISTTLSHWPLILLSVFLCVGLALIYVLRAQPSYSRVAQIVLKEQSSGGSSITSQLEAFADLGFGKSKSNITDEINKLKSPDVMREVVNRLGLQTTYLVPGTFHKDVVYGSTLPLTVDFGALAPEDYAYLKVEVDKKENIRISDLQLNEDQIEFKNNQTFRFGQEIKTPMGPLTINKTPNYQPGEDYTLFVTRSPMTTAIDTYTHKFEIAQLSQKGATIQLTTTDKTIERAEDLINTLLDVYNENWVNDRNAMTVATNKFITDRLVSLEKELGDVDEDITRYQSEHLLPTSVYQVATMYLTEDQKADEAILGYTNQLEMAHYMRDYLKDAAHQKDLLPANLGIGNAALQEQLATYNSNLLYRDRLAENSSETHPVITGLDSQLEVMRKAILTSLDNEIVSLQNRLKKMQEVKGKAQAQIANSPNQANYLHGVGRQQKVKESLYLFLLQKREENELSKTFVAYNIQVITKPYGKMKPIAPRKKMIVGFAFIMGLFIPFGVTYMYEALNTKVRGKKDLASLTMPFLGEIPLWSPKMSKKEKAEREAAGIHERIVVEEGNRDIINDAFRVLRTNINFMLNQDKKRREGGSVVMITSVNPGSGKSYITVNLAIALSLRNKRVIIIDGDLRHGSSSEVVGQPGRGISDYLSERTDDWRSLVVKDKLHKDADLLPVGQFPPNPSELLESARFAGLLETLRKEYDVILIDCPPIEMMADAQIIEELSDRCVFVLRVGLLDKSMIPELEHLYEEKKFKNMSIILNGTESSGKFGNKNAYGYHYGNSYHSS